MGSYSLPGYIGANIALEFFYVGPAHFFPGCILMMRTERRSRVEIQARQVNDR
jgi:hypothetical protein